MSRSGLYESDDCDWRYALYRARVANATRGKRGQAFFKDMLAALDAMPVKELHREVFDEGVKLENEMVHDGGVCALGALARARGIDITDADPDDESVASSLATKFDIAECLSRDVIYINDDISGSPSRRWELMRNWVASQIKEPQP